MSRWAKSVSYDGSESSHTYTLKDESYIDTPKALRLLDQIIERASEEVAEADEETVPKQVACTQKGATSGAAPMAVFAKMPDSKSS